MVNMLIVDDEVEICDFLKSFFEEKGFEADVALNGQDALKFIKEKKHKIVLCDIRMPDISGLEVLRQVKKLGIASKFIMITGFISNENMKEAKDLGAIDYITKPFSLNYLEKNVITKVLSLL